MATLDTVTINHSVDLERAALGMANGVKPSLDNIADYVRLVLAKYEEENGDKIKTIKDRDALVKQILTYMNEQLIPWTEEMNEQLDTMIAQEIKFENAVLRNATGASLTVPTFDAAMLAITQKPLVLNGKAIGWDDYIGNYTPNQLKAVKQVIVAGWADGLTTTQISRQIVGTKTIKGIIPASYREAQMMAKDLTSHQSSEVKGAFGKKNQDIIVGEKAIVTLDSKTSPICQSIGSRDGGGQEWYYADDGYNFPRSPYHRFCRTTMRFILSPEYEETAIKRTRPAIVNGKVIQVDEDTNWLDLAKVYPSVAETALGPTRAKLIDNMSADEFRKAAYNTLNEPLTLDEVAAKSKRIAKELKPL